MARRVWVVKQKERLEQKDIDDGLAHNCPEIVIGIPPALQYVVHDFDLPCVYQEPEPVKPEPPRNILKEIDGIKADVADIKTHLGGFEVS